MSARLDDFIGQNAVKELVRAKIQFARAKAVVLPHLLLCGERESGRKRFASAIACELGVRFSIAEAKSLKRKIDLPGILMNVSEAQVLVINEIDLIKAGVVDALLNVISDFQVEMLIGAGPGARTHFIPLPRFTMIGTTTKPWQVDERLRRNCIACQFSPYSLDETAGIVMQIGEENGLNFTRAAALDLAQRSGCQPGTAALLLRKVANTFRISPSEPIDQARLREFTEFLASGTAPPPELDLCARLQKMNGVEFEHWTADLFRQAGFRVEVTQASGDHGVDLWAHTGADLVAVQCKRWADTVGEPIIRDLYGAVAAANAKAGYLITTGTFSTQAQQFAEGKMLFLVGLDQLMEAVKVPSILHERLGKRT